MSDREGYDDDRNDDRRPPARGSNSTLWIVLGVLGGLFLLTIAACGGAAFFGFRAAKDVVGQFAVSTGAAEAFLDKLQSNQIPAAYKETSAAYQAGTSQEQFAAFIAKNPALTGHTGRTANTFNMMQVNGVNKFRIQYMLTGPNAGTTCTLMLVEENGTWVVDSLTVP
jgi:flagellar basal body-associated protein FliL